MSRRRTAADEGRPATLGPHRIDTGTAELLQDLDRPSSMTLLVNGVPSSVHDLEDPERLDFDYLRWIATAITTEFPGGGRRLDALHLGAGGCSLPRYLVSQQPDSRHLAVEIDAELATLVRRWFPLPTAPTLRIRVGEARAVLTDLPTDSRDVVVRDAFAGALVPPSLASVEFTQEVRRVLRPGGLYLANTIGVLSEARAEIAAVAAVFEHLAVAAHDSTLRGRQPGNLILFGSDRPFATPALRSRLLRDPTPAHLRDRAELGSAVDARRAPHDAGRGDWAAP